MTIARDDAISVTWLARFFYRTGALHGSGATRATAEEGIQAQREIQRTRHGVDVANSAYRREVPVSFTFPRAEREVTLSGRIDGLRVSETETLVEEYKTTRQEPEAAEQRHGTEHWAQIALYAGLLAQQSAGQRFRLRLTYIHPDTHRTIDREQSMDRAEALRFLEETLSRLDRWLDQEDRHVHERNAGLLMLRFPYPAPRRFQRSIALRCHRAIVNSESLLIEAPTGAGKTMAVLYPAVRALQRDDFRRIVFLTSRTTGARAPLDALNRLNAAGANLRYVHLRARDRVCSLSGTSCIPESCVRSAHYYDRLYPALEALLAYREMTGACIDRVAAEFEICGHELALDAAPWADVIVGDYHYVFDPLGSLQRAAPDEHTIVIVDEAHQLVPRVREMLHCQLHRFDLGCALEEQPPTAVAKRLRGIDRQLVKLAKELGSNVSGVDRPDAFLRSLQRLIDDLAVRERSLAPWPRTQSLVMLAHRWLSIAPERADDRWLWRVELNKGQPGSAGITLDCLDPAVEIRAALDAAGAHIRCSGTVSPLALTQELHGYPDAPAERAGGPFDRSQLAVLHIHDVPTYWRSRTLSLPRLVAVIRELVVSRPGLYLAAFPSFEYLGAFAEAADSMSFAQPCESAPQATAKDDGADSSGLRIVAQTPGMDATDQQSFIDALSSASGTCLGLIVLGGVFAESVDFSRVSLAGVVCVGPGLAPPTTLSEAIATYHDARGRNGQRIAYLQPALVKTVQVAGRLLRTQDSRGVLLLVDPRFGDSVYTEFYPELWSVERIGAEELRTRLANFWQETPAPPRLRGSEEDPLS